MLALRRQPHSWSELMAAKKSTVRVVAVAVKDAALAVGHAADDHVIHPVGEALGLIKKKEPKGKAPRAKPRSSVEVSLMGTTL